MKPICYLRMKDGKPDWAEDCVSEDEHSLRDTYPPEEGYSVIPLYANPPHQTGTSRPECNCPIPTHLHDVGCPRFDPAVGNATVEPEGRRAGGDSIEAAKVLLGRAYMAIGKIGVERERGAGYFHAEVDWLVNSEDAIAGWLHAHGGSVGGISFPEYDVSPYAAKWRERHSQYSSEVKP